MSALRSSSVRRSAALLAFLVAGSSRLLAGPAANTSFFAALDGAPLVVTATLGDPVADHALGILTYELTVRQVLKGRAPQPAAVVVEDLVFPSDRPLLAAGTEWLVTLEPLPPASRYRGLPADRTYLRLRGGRHGVRSAEATAAVQTYLAAAAKPAYSRHRECLDALIAALPSPQVGDDALGALAADPFLTRDLTADQSQRLAPVLADRSMPLERRRALLDLIRDERLLPLLPAVRAQLADPSLAPFARRVLAVFGEAPSTDALRADLQHLDPSARRAALEAAASLPQADRLALLAAVAEDGSDHELRVAAIDVLARDGHAAVPALATLLHDRDRRISAQAAMALAAAGGSDALAALSGTFAAGAYDTQVAAVFALRDIGSNDALRILRAVRAAPPDPRLEKVIDLALGVNTHGH
jgi:hypothetical protein